MSTSQCLFQHHLTELYKSTPKINSFLKVFVSLFSSLLFSLYLYPFAFDASFSLFIFLSVAFVRRKLSPRFLLRFEKKERKVSTPRQNPFGSPTDLTYNLSNAVAKISKNGGKRGFI